MPRPKKWRRICALPENSQFGPLAATEQGEVVVMTVDEYETIRLIDLEGLSQEACAAQMQVARTTVQGIYDRARHKLAQSLVNGCTLCIEGGEYQLCDGQGSCCGQRRCRREQMNQQG